MKYCVDQKWVPPKSPHGLIQESLWPDEWKILVSCIMLNLTTRRQVDGVISDFFRRWPTPYDLETASDIDLIDMIKPLGMWRKRSQTLLRFNREYLTGTWKTAMDLYGCGKYADDCWRIFCCGDWKSVAPQDHALNKYQTYLFETSKGNKQ